MEKPKLKPEDRGSAGNSQTCAKKRPEPYGSERTDTVCTMQPQTDRSTVVAAHGCHADQWKKKTAAPR